MVACSDNALVVQSDCSVLLELHSPRADRAREAIAPFAELVKSPEHVHTYRLTPLFMPDDAPDAENKAVE